MDSYPDRETESLLKGKLEKFNWEKPPILKQWGELAAKLKETKWAKAFKKDNPKEYFTALKLAIAKPCKVTIKRNRVTYNYSIQSVANPEFCMDIFTNRKNAEDLIKYMGWELVEKEI